MDYNRQYRADGVGQSHKKAVGVNAAPGIDLNGVALGSLLCCLFGLKPVACYAGSYGLINGLSGPYLNAVGIAEEL